MKIIYIISIIIAISMVSCIPEESPIAPHQSGDVLSGSAEMGTLYLNQVYFSLKEGKVVSTNKFTDFDIEFSCLPDTFAIKLNGARFMKIHNTGKVKFDEVGTQDTASLDETQWLYDNPFGKLDSTSIGNWWESKNGNTLVSKQEVYIINRGVTERGKHTGYRKFQVLGVEDNTYFIKVSNLDGTNLVELEIQVNPKKNFVQVSFNSGAVITELEPDYDQWDFCFTKYTDLLYTSEGDAVWYSVTGPLTNRRFVKTSVDTSFNFEEIKYENVLDLTYSQHPNTIGHDWKWFDLGKGAYIINPNINYVLQTANGIYKLHFIGFYNDAGEKGYPKFEYQLL
jgi:hypothetical protein